MNTTRRSNSEAYLIDMYRVALVNCLANQDIATSLASMGYDDHKINEGKALWTSATNARSQVAQSKNEVLMAKRNYEDIRAAVRKTYSLHRKLTRLACRNHPEYASLPGLKGQVPKKHREWIGAMHLLYSVLLDSEPILNLLSNFNVTEQMITEALASVESMEEARAVYQRRIFERQQAVLSKNEALSILKRWMSDFYAIARIALHAQPQLMEALGKVVKS